MIVRMLKSLHKALPLKAKRRLNKKLVALKLKSAPKARGKVRKPRKPVVTQTTPEATPSSAV